MVGLLGLAVVAFESASVAFFVALVFFVRPFLICCTRHPTSARRAPPLPRPPTPDPPDPSCHTTWYICVWVCFFYVFSCCFMFFFSTHTGTGPKRCTRSVLSSPCTPASSTVSRYVCVCVYPLLLVVSRFLFDSRVAVRLTLIQKYR